MKIIIIGDTASGKSTFANELGKILSYPVVHLDKIMDSMGRAKINDIEKYIENETKKENWIIDGNAFTKDKNKRIYATDIVFVFNLNPFISVWRHFVRYLKISFKKQERIGSDCHKLNLLYYIPYIFFKFPKRKKVAVSLAKNLGKKVIEINDFKEADKYLSEINTSLSILKYDTESSLNSIRG